MTLEELKAKLLHGVPMEGMITREALADLIATCDQNGYQRGRVSMVQETPNLTRMLSNRLNSTEPRNHYEMILPIIQRVAKLSNVSAEDILGRGRTQSVAHARQLAMFLARTEHVDLSLSEIAAAFDRSEHGTISHAVEAINFCIEERERRTVEALKQYHADKATELGLN